MLLSAVVDEDRVDNYDLVDEACKAFVRWAIENGHSELVNRVLSVGFNDFLESNDLRGVYQVEVLHMLMEGPGLESLDVGALEKYAVSWGCRNGCHTMMTRMLLIAPYGGVGEYLSDDDIIETCRNDHVEIMLRLTRRFGAWFSEEVVEEACKAFVRWAIENGHSALVDRVLSEEGFNAVLENNDVRGVHQVEVLRMLMEEQDQNVNLPDLEKYAVSWGFRNGCHTMLSRLLLNAPNRIGDYLSDDDIIETCRNGHMDIMSNLARHCGSWFPRGAVQEACNGLVRWAMENGHSKLANRVRDEGCFNAILENNDVRGVHHVEVLRVLSVFWETKEDRAVGVIQ